MNTQRIIDAIIDREGSAYTDRNNDPGGPTKYGITLATLISWRGHQCTALDVMNLERAEAADIYRFKYYLQPGFGKVAALSQRIADELTDTGVNCGVCLACLFLQRCLNAFNKNGKLYADVALDGDIGPRTLSALSTYLAVRHHDDGEAVMAAALNCLQGERYIDLAEKSSRLEDFTFGWIRNRVLTPA